MPGKTDERVFNEEVLIPQYFIFFPWQISFRKYRIFFFTLPNFIRKFLYICIV